eukprot:CAMPEP_0179001386 /NCGR_PEP_ID=MMETSP0795-20121207/11331_1 /TAXON_ID=88552 /ORGANISM="Amoebophrya sp., Strain Ameob2" /LENGTH=996 /DNA_ID=CAMNT_0020694753 /DNA_START=44 /DNA_END=3034 /DNA_ORIENTATION=+
MPELLYRPALAWVGGRLVENAEIAVDTASGKITRVSTALPPVPALSTSSANGASSTIVALPNRILLPGFVNCHSHAFQRGLRGKGEEGRGDFWTWRKQMHHLVTTLDEADFEDHCYRCFCDMRESGVTTVGEFHYFHHAATRARAGAIGSNAKEQEPAPDYQYDVVILRAAKRAGIRIVLLSAYYARGGVEIPELNEGQMRFRSESVAQFLNQLEEVERNHLACNKTQSVGVVAHSIRALTVHELAELLRYSKAKKKVFHMHVEEQRQEIEQSLKGNKKTPLRCLLDAAAQVDAVDLSFATLVHCTHSTEKDLDEYVNAKRGNVCVCPLTEGSLADGLPKSLQKVLEAGAAATPSASNPTPKHSLRNPGAASHVVVGSDSNLRIDLLEEVRWLEYGQRLHSEKRGHFSLAELVDVLTVNGARSLGVPVGRLEVGCYADFTVLDANMPLLAHPASGKLSGDEFLAAAVFGCGAADVVCGTVVGGEWRGKDVKSVPRPILLALKPNDQEQTKAVVVPPRSTTSGFALRARPQWSCDCHWRIAPGAEADECEPVIELAAAGGRGAEGAPAAATASTSDPCLLLPDHAQRILKQKRPDVVELARVLIDIDSVSGTEVLMAKALQLWFAERDYTVQLQPVEPETGKRDGKDRFNVLAYPREVANPGTLPLIFNTHIDVVPPWFKSELRTVDGKVCLTGRGACDTKSLIAAMLLAVDALGQKSRFYRESIGFLFVVSEETTHQGMKRANFLEPRLQPKFLIVGEPTAGRVQRFQKGILKLKIVCRGVAAHSGYPHLGVSACEILLNVMAQVRGYPSYPKDDVIGQTDCNIGFLEGGQATNALAEEASATLMFRLVSPPAAVWKVLEQIAKAENARQRAERKNQEVFRPENGNGEIGQFAFVKLEKITENAPVDLTHVDKFLDGKKWAFGTACFNTDIPYFENKETKSFLYGHGDICDAHCPREFIGVEDLRLCELKYAEMAQELLDRGVGGGGLHGGGSSKL